MIDLSGLKPGRFHQGDMERLFSGLPNQNKTKYIIALPDKMVDDASKIADEYSESVLGYSGKSLYSVAKKDGAHRILKLH